MTGNYSQCYIETRFAMARGKCQAINMQKRGVTIHKSCSLQNLRKKKGQVIVLMVCKSMVFKKYLSWLMVVLLFVLSIPVNAFADPADSNPVLNSGFDTGIANWTPSNYGTYGHDATEGNSEPGSMKMNRSAENQTVYVKQIIEGYHFIPGATYSLTAYVKGSVADTRGVQLMIRYVKDGATVPGSKYDVCQLNTNWTKIEQKSKMPTGQIDKVEVWVRNSTIGDVWIDDVELKLVSLPDGYIPEIESITPVDVTTAVGKEPVLPSVVTAVYADKSTSQVPVVWEGIDPAKYSTEGSFTVEGSVSGTNIKAVANVTVKKPEEPQFNPVCNPGFDTGYENWEPGVHGTYQYDSAEGKTNPGSIKMYRPDTASSVLISQKIEGYEFIPGATYSLTAYAKGSKVDARGVHLMIRWERFEDDGRVTAVKGLYTQCPLNTNWAKIEQESEMPTDPVDQVTVYIKNFTIGDVWIDDVEIRLVKLPEPIQDDVAPIPEELLVADTKGGAVIQLPNFKLSEPGAKWQKGYMAYNSAGEHGYYLMKQGKDLATFYSESVGKFNLKANRNYVLSIVINNEFDRDTEIDIGVHMMDYDGVTILKNTVGTPQTTDGWVRYEFEFTSAMEETIGQFYLQHNSRSSIPVKFRIADLTVIELPEKPLVPYGTGQGVTFRGGPGTLDMKVMEPVANGTLVTVRTTGALFTFDTGKGTIETKQMLEKERVVAVWKSSASLEGLSVLSSDDKVCVLANSSITIGIQCDSLMMIAPAEELTMTVTGRMGGNWNRYLKGHLYLVDDYGGMTVNPAIPLGSGRVPRTQWLSGAMEAENWQANWTVSPGERLGITVFPPRPYDWEASFDSVYTVSQPGSNIGLYKNWSDYINTVLLWQRFYYSGYAVTYGDYEVKDEVDFMNRVNAIHDADMNAIVYMSPYFYQHKEPEVFIKQPEKFKENYGINGVYYDGVHSQDWVSGYEVMRMTRELFPDGVIILHTTGQFHNGGPPLAIPDIFIPVVDTYSTMTLRGEMVAGSGKDWAYPQYITSQYRKANNFGLQKGDAWNGVPQEHQDLINLLYNGRTRTMEFTNGNITDKFINGYFRILKELEQVWKENGDDPEFYEKYYLPKAKELILPIIGEMPEKVIESITPVNVETTAGIAPVLPLDVPVAFTNKSSGLVPVQWDTVPEESYANQGSFTVQGSVYGSDIKALANVTVHPAQVKEPDEEPGLEQWIR